MCAANIARGERPQLSVDPELLRRSDVNSMSTLLDGKLLANDTSTALCDQAAADAAQAAQAEDGTEEASGGSD